MFLFKLLTLRMSSARQNVEFKNNHDIVFEFNGEVNNECFRKKPCM